MTTLDALFCCTSKTFADVIMPSHVQRSWCPKVVLCIINYAYKQCWLPSKRQTGLLLCAAQWLHYHALKPPSLPQRSGHISPSGGLTLRAVGSSSSSIILTGSQQKRMQSSVFSAQLNYAVAVILTGVLDFILSSYSLSPDQHIIT